MKSNLILSLISGLIIGSFVTYKFRDRSPANLTQESAARPSLQTAAAPKNAKPTEKANPKALEEMKDSDREYQKTNLEKTSALSSSSSAPNLQACLDQLKPSHIDQWHSVWSKKVDDFLVSNDSFWNSKGHRSFDPQAFPSIRGTYKGTWRLPENPRLKAEITVQIKSQTDGVINLDLLETNSTGEQLGSSSCGQDLIPQKDLGHDEKDNTAHFFFHNCNPSTLGSNISKFAFRISLDTQKGQQKRTEIYGLSEDFAWKPAGVFDFIKQ